MGDSRLRDLGDERGMQTIGIIYLLMARHKRLVKITIRYLMKG